MDKLVPLEKYQDFMANFPICTVDVVLFNQVGKTLLFKRNNNPYKGDYFTLGGRLLKNEAPLDCAIRQLSSEVGIKVKKNQLKFVGVLNEINPSSIFADINYHSVNLFYSLTIDSGTQDLRLDSQHSECKWFRVDDTEINRLVKEKLKACGAHND